MSRLANFPAHVTEGKSGYNRADYVLAVACFLASLFVLITCWQTVGVQADESVYIYGALRLLGGEQIYHDFWVFNPPGIFFLIAAITKIFGRSLLAIRLVLFVVSSVVAALLYLLSRRFAGRTLSLLPPLLFVTAGVDLWPVSGHQWYSTLIIVFSMFCIVGFLHDRSRRVLLFTGGVLAATVFLFQQPKGSSLLVSMGALLLLEPWLIGAERKDLKDSIRAVLLFSAGAVSVFLVVGAFFFFNHTLAEAFDAVIAFPIRMMSNGGGEESGFVHFYGFLTRDLLSHMVQRSAFLSNGGLSIPIVVFLINYAGPLSIPLAVIAWAIRRWRKMEKNAFGLLFGLGAASAFTAPVIRPDFHHLLSVTAPEYLALAYVLQSVWDSGMKGKGERILKGLAACSALILALASLRIAIATVAYSSRLITIPLRSPLGFVTVLPRPGAPAEALSTPIVSVLDFLEMRTRPDEKIFVMSFSPFFYYLSGRQSPARCIDIPSSPCTGADFHILKFGEASFNRQRLLTVVEDLDADHTRWIVMDPATSCQIVDRKWAAAASSDPLIEYITMHYRIEAEFASYIILVRSD